MTATSHAPGHAARPSMSTVYMIGGVAALAGLLFGMDIGVISGALPFIEQDFGVSDRQQEIIVSVMMLGAAFGACASGTLSRKMGRKLTLTVSGVVFVAGALLSALAVSPEMLIVARLVLGVAVGISSYVAPIYLSEIAPEHIRGRLISFYQLMIMGGILLAYLTNTLFSYSGNWRGMLGIIAVPGVLLLLGMIFLPRSPRWLASSGRFDEARSILMRLRGNDSKGVDEEMAQIRSNLKIGESGWALFKRNANFRRSTGLGMTLQFMQQFTGANVILYYAPRILEMAGFDSASEQLWGTVVIGLVMTLATLIAVGLVDRAGRKPLLYTGFTIMGLCMLALGALFEYGLEGATTQYLALGLLGMFVISYAMSAAPMVWILCSEIQPLKGRDFGVACSTVTNWVANMIIGATFLTLINVLGNAMTFWLYAALNFAFIGITLMLVPETRGVALERIEQALMAGKRLRHIGRPVRG
ncbi:MFS transporter, SP family, galactose:H+ symporter [Kushneria avicenniae]|uniref:MFS transporter, SP family, galactose:H+ symporter n=1 Tax=Kushneria avicenniae TaxID=402385 RepID=A0A1I1KSJ4_9GAMM|nr:sugar porter family MFS transporter [Kushneria avicenniae]SFC63777.1 MFS transporter, SP family, galactose:H+ symporter [Kushneria avicenniae]